MPKTFSQRSQTVFPAGCNGEFNLPPELATVIVRGEGCRLWTAERTEMLDFSMGWGSVLLGHAHPSVAGAVNLQLKNGTNFAYVTLKSLELGEEIVRLSAACDMVRFCASGTEATMYCLRLARAFTGRPKVLKFEGAYHGAHDVGVASLFPTVAASYPAALPSSAGTIGDEQILIAPFNDLNQTRQIVDANADSLAAIIVEPLQRCLPPVPGFLEGLRRLADREGICLIFDEVVTGFRLAYGGAQEYYGVVPDLVAYGKALGGGLPIGAFGGRAEILELAREDKVGKHQYVWTASTLGGNPLSSAAALATLQTLQTGDTYPRLHRLGKYLRAGMKRVLQRSGEGGHVVGDGPLAQIALTDHRPQDYRSSQHRDTLFARQLMLELFRRGIFLNPMGTKLYLSLAHDEGVCDRFCDALGDALQTLANPKRAHNAPAVRAPRCPSS